MPEYLRCPVLEYLDQIVSFVSNKDMTVQFMRQVDVIIIDTIRDSVRLPDTFDVGTISAVLTLLSVSILAAYPMLVSREIASVAILFTKRRQLGEVSSVLVN
jgi:hypothetical protein